MDGKRLGEVRTDIPGIKVGGELTLTLYRTQDEPRWQCSISGPMPPGIPEWEDGETIASSFLQAMQWMPIGSVILLTE
jgi:hypothetical protein